MSPEQRPVALDARTHKATPSLVLHTALSASLASGRPFQLTEFQAPPEGQGLLRGHLHALHAATALSSAHTEGIELHATGFAFTPGAQPAPGTHRFALSNAHSCTELLLLLLPALMRAESSSTLEILGGTHTPGELTPEHITRGLLPHLGWELELETKRCGFAPAGAGLIHVQAQPSTRTPAPLLLDEEPNDLLEHSVEAITAHLSGNVARRELNAIHEALGWPRDALTHHPVEGALCPGNALIATLVGARHTTVLTAFGVPGVPAEAVAQQLIQRVQSFRAARAPVDSCAARVLLIPLVLSGGGRLLIATPDAKLLCAVAVAQAFWPGHFLLEPIANDPHWRWMLEILPLT